MPIEIIFTCEKCGKKKTREVNALNSVINLNLNSDTGDFYIHQSEEDWTKNIHGTLLCSDCMEKKKKIVEKYSKECDEEVERFINEKEE